MTDAGAWLDSSRAGQPSLDLSWVVEGLHRWTDVLVAGAAADLRRLGVYTIDDINEWSEVVGADGAVSGVGIDVDFAGVAECADLLSRMNEGAAQGPHAEAWEWSLVHVVESRRMDEAWPAIEALAAALLEQRQLRREEVTALALSAGLPFGAWKG